MQRVVGVLGGSGLYDMTGLGDRAVHRVVTTFGHPSDEIVSGELAGARFLFLPRHGRGHRLAPHEINYRANILALKQLGAEQIISISAVGSLREDVHPGDVVLVDQFIDRTRTRPSTFFEDLGVVAHVGFSDPTDVDLSAALDRAGIASGARVHRGGTYVCVEGPQFSTRAESNVFRSWGGTVIGMTNLPEARLAREAQLPYATVALVTDYDCWKTDEPPVSVERVVQMLHTNVALAQRMLVAVAGDLPDPATSPASTALVHALLTPEAQISPAAREKLAQVFGPPGR